MKYSINGTGNIVAERDIYSLGGFIPKWPKGTLFTSASMRLDGVSACVLTVTLPQ